MDATEHLMSSEANAKRLRESMAQVDELRQKRAERDNPELSGSFVAEALYARHESLTKYVRKTRTEIKPGV